MPDDEISNKDEILVYLHCGQCLAELKAGKNVDYSPKEYQRIQAGWTKRGLQIWCVRHNVNVVHIDFEGHKHPANTTAAKEVSH